ncbi:MAG TPA: hypothetical protein VL987_02450 [Cellvibrio sp.]|nr:hypothetical protein [Cellvibrio sp.]
MIAHKSLFSAPSASTDTGMFAQFCELYRQRQDALNLIKQLIQMIKAVQRHRGMSMALLGGNTLFREEFDRLQLQLERRLMSLQTFAAHTNPLLSERDQENLHSAWVTISRDWQQDSVIDNYELHCHLIEQLLGMLATLAKQLEQPVSALVNNHADVPLVNVDGTNYPNRFRHLEVLHFSTRLMPSVVEQIGRIRALATYAAAIGHCDSHHDGKLRYVIQCTRVNNEKLRHQAKRLEGILEGDIGLLGQLKSYEIKLMFLLTMVETDVLHGGKITTDSNRLFSVATDIIDVYLHVIEDGIQLITRWHEEDIETWLQSA